MWAATLHLTRWRALSTVLVSHSRRSPLLAGDHPLRRLLADRARQDLLQGGLGVAGGGRGLGEGHALVERRMLVAAGRLHRGDDLPGDAQLGEVAKARLAVGAEVPDRLVEAD